MKINKSIPIVLTLAMAHIMSSCLKSNNDSYTVNQAYPNLFNAVVNLSSGDITLYPEQSFKVEWDLIKQTANLQVNGLKVPDGGSYPTLYFKDVKWGYNAKGWYDITLTDYTPSGSSSYISNLVFNKFNFQTLNRAINNINFPPCLSISYTINNEYKVYALPMEIIEAGTTTITAPDGSNYVPSDKDMAIYYLEIDPATKKAFIVIQDAQLYKGMEKSIVRFKPLDLDVNQAGHITCTGTDITPYKLKQSEGINGKGEEMPEFTITDFNATYISDYGLTITYKCTYKDEVYSTKFVNVYPQQPQQTDKN